MTIPLNWWMSARPQNIKPPISRRQGFSRSTNWTRGISCKAGIPPNPSLLSASPVSARQVQLVIGAIIFTGSILALASDPLFAIIPLLAGGGLMFTGLTGTCGLALLLMKMPWNKRRETNSQNCCNTNPNREI